MSEIADEKPEDGDILVINGYQKIYYAGYWIRYYAPPAETLSAKKQLIESLKRRLFHHTESGINTPGHNLETARLAYESETTPERKRVNAAMLAGALFNRATDIFTSVVDLEANGVHISPDNELMRKCGEYFQEALKLGKQVKHHSGHEGVDELWGEPLKAFTLSTNEFYRSRYIKISHTMRDIDKIALVMVELFSGEPGFKPALSDINEFANAAKIETETIRSDPAMFEVWPTFVSTGERIIQFRPKKEVCERTKTALKLLADGKALISYLAGVRTPMPKSTQEYILACRLFAETNSEV